jgi:hypothetical protein
MNPLKTVAGTIIGGIVLAVIIAVATTGIQLNAASLMVWIHVLAGITWIGLLYYFNFVQVPALADAAGDEGGPGGAGMNDRRRRSVRHGYWCRSMAGYNHAVQCLGADMA